VRGETMFDEIRSEQTSHQSHLTSQREFSRRAISYLTALIRFNSKPGFMRS